jgi:DNA mismatch repair protein MutL
LGATAGRDEGLRLPAAGLVPVLTLGHDEGQANVFGGDVRDHLYAVEAEQGGVSLAGYVADPACERGTAGMQRWFVNGRWIRDRHLSQALHEAYRGLVMTGRHPVAFLFLELPPDEVDVNVHPAKAEVRFRDRQEQLVETAVRDRLRGEDLTARLRAPATPRPATPPAAPALPGFEAGVGSPPAPRDTPPVGEVRAFQLHGLYLVVEVPEGMLLIDQHALHERVLFEQFQQRLRAGPLDAQKLLVPEPVELSPVEAALVLQQREALAALGLGVEPFGSSTVLLTGYPAVLGRRPPRGILDAVVEYLRGVERPPGRDRLLHELLSVVACHGAVRAGDRLTDEEIAALVAQRHLAQDTHHCPHGRPTSLLFTRQELDRQFRRR